MVPSWLGLAQPLLCSAGEKPGKNLHFSSNSGAAIEKSLSAYRAELCLARTKSLVLDPGELQNVTAERGS